MRGSLTHNVLEEEEPVFERQLLNNSANYNHTAKLKHIFLPIIFVKINSFERTLQKTGTAIFYLREE